MADSVRTKRLFRIETIQFSLTYKKGGKMKPKEVIQGLLTAMENQRWEDAEKHLADNFTFSGAVPAPVGKREWIGMHKALEAGMPDFRFNLHDVKENGSKVQGKVQITGTHSRPIPGPVPGTMLNKKIEPTGKKINLPAEECEFEVAGDRVKQLYVKPVDGGGVPGLLSQIGYKPV
jgi:hypothetical protein